MADLNDLFQSADWKKEKHVPVIDAPDTAKKGDLIQVTVSVGKEIAHPNTTEHHIRSIDLYFLASGDKFPYQLAHSEFNTHGESTEGPNTSTVYSYPKSTVSFKSDKSGTIFALSNCNIHGMWKGIKEIQIL